MMVNIKVTLLDSWQSFF